MKCRLIKDSPGRNPAFDAEEHLRCKQQGKPYLDAEGKPIEKSVTFPSGTILEGPYCFLHTLPGYMNSPAIAVPADDECRAAFKREMDKRQMKIAQLALYLDSQVKNEAERHHRANLRSAYAEELYEHDPEKYPIPKENDADIQTENETDPDSGSGGHSSGSK